MPDVGRDDDGAVDPAERFSYLVKTAKDLQTNWNIDLQKELDAYIDRVRSLLANAEERFDFVGAAHVVACSSIVWGRKVDLVYQEVLNLKSMLSSGINVANKKKSRKDENEPDEAGSDGECAADGEVADAARERRLCANPLTLVDYSKTRPARLDVLCVKNTNVPLERIYITPMSLIPLADYEKTDVPLYTKRGTKELIGRRDDFHINTGYMHLTGAVLLEPGNTDLLRELTNDEMEIFGQQVVVKKEEPDPLSQESGTLSSHDRQDSVTGSQCAVEVVRHSDGFTTGRLTIPSGRPTEILPRCSEILEDEPMPLGDVPASQLNPSDSNNSAPQFEPLPTNDDNDDGCDFDHGDSGADTQPIVVPRTARRSGRINLRDTATIRNNARSRLPRHEADEWWKDEDGDEERLREAEKWETEAQDDAMIGKRQGAAAALSRRRAGPTAVVMLRMKRSQQCGMPRKMLSLYVCKGVSPADLVAKKTINNAPRRRVLMATMFAKRIARFARLRRRRERQQICGLSSRRATPEPDDCPAYDIPDGHDDDGAGFDGPSEGGGGATSPLFDDDAMHLRIAGSMYEDDEHAEPRPPSAGASFTDIVVYHLQTYWSRASAETGGLHERVDAWETRMKPLLEEEQGRAEFDIHEYGRRVVSALDSAQDKSASLTELLSGVEWYEVSRYLLSSLIMANKYDVSLAEESDEQNEDIGNGERFFCRLPNGSVR